MNLLRCVFLAAVTAITALTVSPAFAQKNGGGTSTPADGVIAIDQTKAMNGNITPGDGAGFPITISQPGAYKLAGNLTVGSASTHAIEITADGVTLDLSGFAIQGAVTCTATYTVPSSISCQPWSQSAGVMSNRSGTTVRNGTIRGFAMGVYAGDHGTVEGVHVSHVSEYGISGQDALMRSNQVFLSGGSGLAGSGVIRDNVTSMTRAYGILGTRETLIVGNRVRYTDSFGINANASGAAGTAHNVVAYTKYNPINGGISLGGNACNGAPC